MTKLSSSISRRSFLAATGIGAAAMAMPWGRQASAANYPGRNLTVTIPTGQGGGADRLSRTFFDTWKKYLGVGYEPEFFPGAAGQIGYELWIHKRPHDGHHLLFGNAAAEMIMYALQNPNFRYPDDLHYFCGLDVDSQGLWVTGDSPYQHIDQVIEVARKRPVSIAVSRLPHPGTIGILALAEATGAQFNIVPYGGGNPQTVAVINKECELGGGGVAGYLEKRRVLVVFNDEEFVFSGRPDYGTPVLANKHFGTNIPEIYSHRAWAVHADWADAHPTEYEFLVSTSAKVFTDPQFKKDIIERKDPPWETISYKTPAQVKKLALGMMEMAKKYEAELTKKT
jgi:tripartite-type tricarboxylate transporter receptor subunit TctC